MSTYFYLFGYIFCEIWMLGARTMKGMPVEQKGDEVIKDFFVAV